jgi:hypothetical protein
VSTTLVVNLELGIFPRIFEKIKTVLMGYSGAGGKLIHEKKQKQKISRHCPLKGREGTSTPQALITSKFNCLVVPLHCTRRISLLGGGILVNFQLEAVFRNITSGSYERFGQKKEPPCR